MLFVALNEKEDLYTKTLGRTASSRALTEPPYLVTRRNFAQCLDPISKLAYPRPEALVRKILIAFHITALNFTA